MQCEESRGGFVCSPEGVDAKDVGRFFGREVGDFQSILCVPSQVDHLFRRETLLHNIEFCLKKG